jgi:hypothetical protein
MVIQVEYNEEGSVIGRGRRADPQYLLPGLSIQYTNCYAIWLLGDSVHHIRSSHVITTHLQLSINPLTARPSHRATC